jgi:hypothetical protein
MKSPKVFISYSHDSKEHEDRVFDLSEELISDGIDSQIDQYEISPLGGWPRWTRNQIKDSEYVLVVCTAKYERRYEGTEDPGTGAGAKWEGAIITQQLYESEGGPHKFVPIVFSREDIQYIPVELRGSTHYVLDSEDGYISLYRHITSQPKAVKGRLGELKSLPPKQRRQGFSVGNNRNSLTAHDDPASRVESEPARNLSSMVLVMTPEGDLIFVESQRVRVADTINMKLSPSDSGTAAAIDSLSRYVRGNPVGVAFGTKALYARVLSVTHILEGGREIWEVDLKPEADQLSSFRTYNEFNLSGVPSDQVAEMRARRILLDEKLFGPTGVWGGVTNSLNQEFLERSLQGRNSGIQIKESPFPALYSESNGDNTMFLAKARLHAVLLLILSDTVVSINKLDLQMKGAKVVSVKFEGQRVARYVNQPPPIIKVNGVCNLVEED